LAKKTKNSYEKCKKAQLFLFPGCSAELHTIVTLAKKGHLVTNFLATDQIKEKKSGLLEKNKFKPSTR
jgi:hypothetical protein